MNICTFAHRDFSADNWEFLVKDYINNLQCQENLIWYKSGDNKKISEELITLGYYVKYKYGLNQEISFRLNPIEGKEDGWISKNGEILESVQIVIAYYDKEEAEEDHQTMKGEDVVTGGLVGNRMKILERRIKQRIEKKIKKEYKNIDVLLVGVKDWFVKRANDEYKDLQRNLSGFMQSLTEKSQFREVAIVDTDLVGQGGVTWLPNK